MDSTSEKEIVMRTIAKKTFTLAVAVLNCFAFPLLSAPNHAPLANNDNFTINEDTVLTVAPPPGAGQ